MSNLTAAGAKGDGSGEGGDNSPASGTAIARL